ncbi:MAG TPA: chemotaxis protein CheW [Hyphomicrobiaceae bacterium]|nr:chemotaxis protein CheW [Hyphomicrobiaceae bacterium]
MTGDRVAVFELAGYRYAIAIAHVQEFVRLPSIVPLPKAPAIVEGVVNIRGTVVPVLDIRQRFRLPERRPHIMDCLLIARVDQRVVAFRVDRVIGLQDIDPRDIEDSSAIAPGTEYLAGVAKLPDGLVLIQDLRAFLSQAEAQDIDDAIAGAAEVCQ